MTSRANGIFSEAEQKPTGIKQWHYQDGNIIYGATLEKWDCVIHFFRKKHTFFLKVLTSSL